VAALDEHPPEPPDTHENKIPHIVPNYLKTYIVHKLLTNQSVTVFGVRDLCSRHSGVFVCDPNGNKKSVNTMRSEFLAHRCVAACKVLLSEMVQARVGLHLNAVVAENAVISYTNDLTLKRKTDDADVGPATKKARTCVDSAQTHFPQLLDQKHKDQIIKEFLEATNNDSLARKECSFCGLNELRMRCMRCRADRLDISLLQQAVAVLRASSLQPNIEAYKPSTIENGFFNVCHVCSLSIKRDAFVSLPVRSYANGLWLGEIPPALLGLTFLEEQCIARVRATRCMYKLSLTAAGQFASRGNVCILPHDTASFLSVMPPPIATLRDEFCVIIIGSANTEITYDMLRRSPLLVRREKIRAALLWLMHNNPLYSDLDREATKRSLETYPLEGCPLAVADFLRTNSADNQGSSYTSYSGQANSDYFECESASDFLLSSTTLVDVDDVNLTYKQKKLEALRVLKSGRSSFVKFPSGNAPLPTYKNARMYGWLWPTLFPYGVGMIDNFEARVTTFSGFREVDAATHVRQLLSIADRRFQTHKSFIFVMNNIFMRRKTAFKGKLAANRSWFPLVCQLLDVIDEASMKSYQAKLEKSSHSFAVPETEGEKAAGKLMNYISYVSDHIPGSIGDVNDMKDQVRGKIVCDGLPHFFATVNPADAHNPIAQVQAGRGINLDSVFHALDSDNEEAKTRARVIADNPVAGAEFFHLIITKFFDILLGAARGTKIGVLGKVQGWYAVVETQVRGSLHLHILIWIAGAPPSPLGMKDLMNADQSFKDRLLAWYDDIICQSFFPDTVPYVVRDNGINKLPVLSRPADPDIEGYSLSRNQLHRDLCETSGLVHVHNATCFKHIPRAVQAFINSDKDCRFRLPRPLVSDTHFDEDGDLVLRCENGDLNGHNPTITLALGCNTDLKQMASGSVAMATIEYMCNYTTKLQLDTAIVFSALCATIKALQTDPPRDETGDLDTHERSRLLMIKVTNSLVGKRELTGQQTASILLGRSNRYISDEYENFWWSSMLRDIARDVFAPLAATVEELNNPESDRDADENVRLLIPPDEDDSLVFLSPENLAGSRSHDCPPLGEKMYSRLFEDMYHRPASLLDKSLWFIMRNYTKVKLPTSKVQRKVHLRFQPGHSQYTSHCLKERDRPVIPILMGYRIPRNDSDADKIKYAVVILALFKPWSTLKESPLKDPSASWSDSLNSFLPTLDEEHKKVISNMQLLYQTKDAKFDYRAARLIRLKQLNSMAVDSGVFLAENGDGDNDLDPLWENAMQTELAPEDLSQMTDSLMPVNRRACEVADAARQVGFYNKADRTCTQSCGFAYVASEDSRLDAEIRNSVLRSEKDALLKKLQRLSENAALQRPLGRTLDASSRIPAAFKTNLLEEAAKARAIYEHSIRDKAASQSLSVWDMLYPYQQLCLALIIKYTLNEEQARAFLLLADKIGREVHTGIRNGPLTLLCTGPGGTGKSMIFRAWTEFYEIIGHPEQLRLTAPTGVVASDIGGRTIHSELNLRMSPKKMKTSQALRTRLEERLSHVETIILDEVYFLGARDMSRISEYLCIGTGKTMNICGGMNFVVSGDPAQLPPPAGRSLFDRELVGCFKSDRLNDLHENVRQDVKGIQVWHQVEHVVVLDEIMRQKDDPILIDILRRLRTGSCTEHDKTLLDTFVLSSDQCSTETKSLINISSWITDPGDGCPLVVYQNIARDAHNLCMSRALAEATSQECPLYHSRDMVGRGRARRQLAGRAAEAAWSLPVKKANDLGGRVPYLPGMPVFCTENIATELGVSNGSPGTIIHITYEEEHGRRYAVSAEVDFENYCSSDSAANNPHRVTLVPVSSPIHYTLDGSGKLYNATRWQLPLIPAFSFTSHNSQGRTLNKCCVDLASCTSIQSAYVMLSRVRSLSGLCILRPFALDRIRNHISQELRQELERTSIKAIQTKEFCKRQFAWFYDTLPPGGIRDLTRCEHDPEVLQQIKIKFQSGT
jgi:hypothetical protein